MFKKQFVFLLVLALAALACSSVNFTVGNTNTVEGSGEIISESRPVSDFTAVELVGSAEVTIDFGESVRLDIEGEDNILPLVETEVRGSTLFIRTQAGTQIAPTVAVKISLTMVSLENLNISGSGDFRVHGFNGETLRLELPGSGNIVVDGSADRLTVNLGGSGNILCDELQARRADVSLNGSGNINVQVSDTLDATINGSGNIFYSGNPQNVNKNVNGSGSIQQQ